LSNYETIKANDWINQGVILKGGESAAESTLRIWGQLYCGWPGGFWI